MRYTYDAIIQRFGETWSVMFPMFPELCIDGDSRDEAIENAAKALAERLREKIDNHEKLPEQNHTVEAISISVEPMPEELDESEYMTQAQAQEILGVSHSRVSFLVKSGKLESHIIGRRNMVKKSSVEAYAKTPRNAGRPSKDPSND